MKTTGRLMLFTALLLLTVPQAYAYGTVSGHVIQVRVDKQGQGMMVFDTPIGNAPPTCVISYYANAFAFDTNTAGGRSILAAALTAKSTGSVMTAVGAGACTIYNGYLEDANYVVAQ